MGESGTGGASSGGSSAPLLFLASVHQPEEPQVCRFADGEVVPIYSGLQNPPDSLGGLPAAEAGLWAGLLEAGGVKVVTTELLVPPDQPLEILGAAHLQ